MRYRRAALEGHCGNCTLLVRSAFLRTYRRLCLGQGLDSETRTSGRRCGTLQSSGLQVGTWARSATRERSRQRSDAPSTASSSDASSTTMNGALPPSSMLVRFTVAAHCAMRSWPTRVLPVKDSLRTVGCEVSASPMTAASPTRTLNTPWS